MAQLSNPEVATGFTHYLKFNYEDLKRTGFLTTIGAANQKQVGSLPPGGIIDLVAFYQVTDPAGATNLTLDVGTTGSDPDEYIDNLDVDGLTQVAFNTGDAFIGTDSGTATTSNVLNGVANNTASALPIYMEFNGTVADLTAGEWVLAWRQADIGQLA